MKLTTFSSLLSWSSLKTWLPSLNPSAYAYPKTIRSDRTFAPESNVKTVINDSCFHHTVISDTTQLDISVDPKVQIS